MSWLPDSAFAVSVYLGIDIGSARCGLALAPSGANAGPLLATQLGVAATEPRATLAARIHALLGPRRLAALIVGLPLDKRGERGPEALAIEALAGQLHAELAALPGATIPLPLHYVDERFSTAAALSARRELFELKRDTRRAAAQREGRREHIPAIKLREQIDAQVATELLQGWLDSARG